MRYIILALLIVSGTARADGFYIEGGLSAYRKIDAPESTDYTFIAQDSVIDGVQNPKRTMVTVTQFRPYDINYIRNPAGDFIFGYDKDFGRFNWSIQLKHESFIPAGDRGRESVRLSMRWYLFR